MREIETDRRKNEEFMLPPKRTIKNKPSKYSSGLGGELATSSVRPDAARPLMCSKTVPDFGRVRATDSLTEGFDQTFLKHFHRTSRMTISNPATVARLIRARISKDQEELWVMALSAAKRVLAIDMMFRGTADSCLVHPRDIVRFICEANATSYIVAHNHPSGEVEPSDHDWIFTSKLVACGELVEIPLIDHVIVTARSHTSMAALRPQVFKRPDMKLLGAVASERCLEEPNRADAYCAQLRDRLS